LDLYEAIEIFVYVITIFWGVKLYLGSEPYFNRQSVIVQLPRAVMVVLLALAL
jgi:hypothetical protein